jgi:NADH-quinone oxidoreductase subunit J
MHDFFFYLFSVLALLCGFLVVANPFSRSPVASAMFLALTIVFLAGLFVLLEAYFLAAVQILVYAGAVMVLFLFVIMLLNLKEEEGRKLRWIWLAPALVVTGVFALLVTGTLLGARPRADLGPVITEGNTMALGTALFTRFLLPFEIISVLLVVGMLGVILLSKKELK